MPPPPLATLIAILSLAGPSAAFAQERPRPTPTPPRCVVCDHLIEGEGVVLEHRGRRVHLHPEACVEHWHEEPGLYFAELQPRSALFDEPEAQPNRLAPGWLLFGIYVLAGLIGGAICAYGAVSRRRRPLPWFFAGLLLNVVAVALLLVVGRGHGPDLPQGVPRGLRKVPVTRAPVFCTACGAENHPAARACAACASDLEPLAPSEVDRRTGGEAIA